MTLSALIDRPCTIVRRSETGTLDELGNEIPTEALVVSEWELQQRRRDEPEGEGELSATEWIAFFQSSAELSTGDAVIDHDTGRQFELVGEPWPVRNPRTGEASHVEVSVRRVAGAQDAS